jgi:hypothetical protein
VRFKVRVWGFDWLTTSKESSPLFASLIAEGVEHACCQWLVLFDIFGHPDGSIDAYPGENHWSFTAGSGSNRIERPQTHPSALRSKTVQRSLFVCAPTKSGRFQAGKNQVEANLLQLALSSTDFFCTDRVNM